MAHPPAPPLRDLTGNQMAWIGAGYVMMFATLPGQTLMIGQFGSHIRADFGLSDGQYGLLYAAATLASSLVLVGAGTINDRLPPRRVALLVLSGLVLVGVVMSRVETVLGLGLALFGLRFFGQGMMSLTAQTMIARWFNRFRGRALALSQLGFSTGTAILPFTIALGIAALGWRQVWVLTALVLASIVAPAIFFYLAARREKQVGSRPVTANPDAVPEAKESGQNWTRRRVLGDGLFYAALLPLLVTGALVTAVIFHQARLVDEKGWTLLVFAGSFPVLTVTEILTALAVGHLIDRLGAYRLLPGVLLPIMLAFVVMWLAQSVWMIPVLFLFMGASSGAMSPLLGALWPEIYGTAHLGAIRALVTAGAVLASAVGPGIAGLLIDAGVPLASQGPGYAVFCLAVMALNFTLRGRFAQRAALGGADPAAGKV